MHVQSFRYSIMFTHTDTYHCSIIVLSYSFYHQIYIHNHMRFLRFIYSFDNIKYFQVHDFYFFRKTYSTKWVFYSISTSITTVHHNDESMLMKFTMIQINKRWSDHSVLVIHGCTFIANDPSKYNTSTSSINIYIIYFFLIKYIYIYIYIYAYIFNINNNNGILAVGEIGCTPFKLSFYHAIACKVF